MAPTFPASPVTGQGYTDPATGKTWFWNGAAWEKPIQADTIASVRGIIEGFRVDYDGGNNLLINIGEGSAVADDGSIIIRSSASKSKSVVNNWNSGSGSLNNADGAVSGSNQDMFVWAISGGDGIADFTITNVPDITNFPDARYSKKALIAAFKMTGTNTVPPITQIADDFWLHDPIEFVTNSDILSGGAGAKTITVSGIPVGVKMTSWMDVSTACADANSVTIGPADETGYLPNANGLSSGTDLLPSGVVGGRGSGLTGTNAAAAGRVETRVSAAAQIKVGPNQLGSASQYLTAVVLGYALHRNRLAEVS